MNMRSSEESDDSVNNIFSHQNQTQIRIQGPNSDYTLNLPLGNNGRPRYAKSLFDQQNYIRDKRARYAESPFDQLSHIRDKRPQYAESLFDQHSNSRNKQPQYGESLCDLRSHIRDKQDTSPMSLHSITSTQRHNFKHTVNRGAMSSQQTMPQPRYAESLCDLQSHIRHKRDTSPMSLHSITSTQHRNFQHTVHRGAMSFQQTRPNGFGSSMSVQSFGSNASTVDMCLEAYKNFNEHEKRFFYKRIKNLQKKQTYKRIEKRRQKRLFLNASRRRPGYESEEMDGESSGSNDDANSLRTCRTEILYNKSLFSSKSSRTQYTDFRRPMQMPNLYNDRTDNIKQNSFRRSISCAPNSAQERTNLHEPITINQRTQHFPIMPDKNRFGSGFLLPSQRFHQPTASSSITEHPTNQQNKKGHGSSERNETNPARNHQQESGGQSGEIISANPIVEKSQKLNQPVALLSIPEHPHKRIIKGHCSDEKNEDDTSRNHQQESGSKSDEIFSSNHTVGEKNNKLNSFLSKRRFIYNSDDENNCLPQSKRIKLSSLQQEVNTNKRSQKQKEQKMDGETCDFVFARPQLPLKKPATFMKSLIPIQSNEKSKQNSELCPPPKNSISHSNIIQAKEPSIKTSNAIDNLVTSLEPKPVEQLIAMSSQPLDDMMIPNPKQTQQSHPGNPSKDKDHIDQFESTQFSTTDTSMRPSFLKRKLFTQKADIAENKNASSDTIEENSSQSNMYSMIQKEKNRTRKLVTSQSCLNRDLGDESNLLDLIHKIVPPNQLNRTSTTIRTGRSSNKSRPEKNTGDKWDVSLAMTKCNQDEESDTFTDEEIFNTNKTVINSKTTYNNTDGAQKEKPNQIANKLKSPITQVKPHVESNEALKRAAIFFWESDPEDVKTPAKTIPSSRKILNPPVTTMLEDLNPKNITFKSTYNVQKHTKETIDDRRNVTNSTSSNSKRKKTAKDKSVIEPSPQKKLVINATTKQASTCNVENHTKGTRGEGKNVTYPASSNSKQKKTAVDKSVLEPSPQKKLVINATTKQVSTCNVKKNTKETSGEGKNVTNSASSNSKQKKTAEDKSVLEPSPQKKPVINATTKQASTCNVKKHTKETSGEGKNVTNSTSSNSKQKKTAEDKSVLEPSPQKKPVINATTKQISTCKVKKHTKETSGEGKNVTNSTSSNSKQKKTAKDKSFIEPLPQNKPVINAKTKRAGNSKKLATKAKKNYQDTDVTNTPEKLKVCKILISNENIQEIINRKEMHSNQETTFIQGKVVNKTRRNRACQKSPQCCEVEKKYISVNDKLTSLTKSLRNRKIDLSTTASSGLDTTCKDVPKQRGRPRKNNVFSKIVENKENVPNVSDLSFTLPMEKTKIRSDNNGVLNDDKKRPSNVSFYLVVNAKNLNETGVTTRAAHRLRSESKITNLEDTKLKSMSIKSPLKIGKKKTKSKT